MYKIYIFVIIAMLILIVFCFALAEYAERVKLNAFIYSLCSILVIPGIFVSAQTNFIEKTSMYLMINEGESKFTPSFNINDTQVLLGDYEEESVFSEVTGKFLILKEEYELTGFKCDVPFDENGEYDDEFYEDNTSYLNIKIDYYNTKFGFLYNKLVNGALQGKETIKGGIDTSYKNAEELTDFEDDGTKVYYKKGKKSYKYLISNGQSVANVISDIEFNEEQLLNVINALKN